MNLLPTVDRLPIVSSPFENLEQSDQVSRLRHYQIRPERENDNVAVAEDDEDFSLIHVKEILDRGQDLTKVSRLAPP